MVAPFCWSNFTSKLIHLDDPLLSLPSRWRRKLGICFAHFSFQLQRPLSSGCCAPSIVIWRLSHLSGHALDGGVADLPAGLLDGAESLEQPPVVVSQVVKLKAQSWFTKVVSHIVSRLTLRRLNAPEYRLNRFFNFGRNAILTKSSTANVANSYRTF